MVKSIKNGQLSNYLILYIAQKFFLTLMVILRSTNFYKLHLVAPAAVPNVIAQRLYSGNCSEVRWQSVNTGHCPVEYTVQFLNDTHFLGNITGIEDKNRSICSKEYFYATSIVIWATYNGTEGNKTKKMVSLTTTTATPTTTASATAKSGTVWTF